MKRGAVLISLLLLASCSTDRDAGRRYQAERDIWRADWEYKRLSIRPQEIAEGQWSSLAQRYEAIAARYARRRGTAVIGKSQEQTQIVAARALFTAALIHATLRDSIRAEQIYEQMAQEFAQIPELAAEIALTRGKIAEDKGDRDAAVTQYQDVVDKVPPKPDGMGAASLVLDLPLRIARLQAQGAQAGDKAEVYARARLYYERLLESHHGDLVQLDSLDRLSQIAADLGDWPQAILFARDLESHLQNVEDPPEDPASVRYTIAGWEALAGMDPESIRVTLLSVLKDYSHSKAAPQALFALADNASSREDVNVALGFLDRVVNEYKEDEDATSAALLSRAKLLESHDRWPEALETFRTISAQHPVGMAALAAPLEIAGHYARAGDKDARVTALKQAERDYRDFIARYPSGRTTVAARERLVQALSLQGNYDSAVKELLSLGEEMTGKPGGANYLIAAAQMACTQLADTARAVTILDRACQLYAKTRVGQWASDMAERLQGKTSR